VEEFAASTTSTWDANAAVGNSVYGPAGAPISGNLSAGGRTKVVRFQNPIQSTDRIVVELMGTAGVWFDATSAYPYNRQNSVYYGVEIFNNGTDVQVYFGQYATTSGATYGSAGGEWGTSGVTAWRVRKVSGGASVGYPISARNIVGDTSGTAVPAGMIGEKKESIAAGYADITYGAYDDTGVAALSLTAGEWKIRASCSYAEHTATTAVTSMQVFVGTATGNSSTGYDPLRASTSVRYQSATRLSTGTAEISTPEYQVTVSGATNFYCKTRVDGSGGSVWAKGYIVATRIA
jgi:hypothetical protein